MAIVAGASGRGLSQHSLRMLGEQHQVHSIHAMPLAKADLEPGIR